MAGMDVETEGLLSDVDELVASMEAGKEEADEEGGACVSASDFGGKGKQHTTANMYVSEMQQVSQFIDRQAADYSLLLVDAHAVWSGEDEDPAIAAMNRAAEEEAGSVGFLPPLGKLVRDPHLPLAVRQQRLVLLFLAIAAVWIGVLAAITYGAAEPHRHSVHKNAALGAVAALFALQVVGLLALRRYRCCRLIVLATFASTLGLLLGFTGLWLHSLIPVMLPVTLVVQYAFLGLVTNYTRNVFAFVPAVVLNAVIALITHIIWWFAINKGWHDALEPFVAVALLAATIGIDMSLFLTLSTLARQGRRPHAVGDALYGAFVDPLRVTLRAFTCCCYCRQARVGGRTGVALGSTGCYCHPSVCLSPDVTTFTDLHRDEAQEEEQVSKVEAQTQEDVLLLDHKTTAALLSEMASHQGHATSESGYQVFIAVADLRSSLRRAPLREVTGGEEEE